MESVLGICTGATFAVLSGLAFRIRGGWLGAGARLGTGGTRIAWAATMAILAALAGFNPWYLATAPAWFLGSVFGWGGAIDLGRNEGDWWGDAQAMLMRGLWWTAPAGFTIYALGGQAWFALVGCLCVPSYEIGWRVPVRLPGFTQGPEVGEFIFGAAMGLALWAVL